MGLLSSPIGSLATAALRAPLEALATPAAAGGAGGGFKATIDDIPPCGTVPRGPFPPIPHAVAAVIGHRGSEVSLNPQPLPPGPARAGGLLHGVRFALDDWCGTVPPKPPVGPHGPIGPVGPGR